MFYVVCFVCLNIFDNEFVIYIDLSWNDPVKLPVFFAYLQNIIIKTKQVITLCVYVYFICTAILFL